MVLYVFQNKSVSIHRKRERKKSENLEGKWFVLFLKQFIDCLWCCWSVHKHTHEITQEIQKRNEETPSRKFLLFKKSLPLLLWKNFFLLFSYSIFQQLTFYIPTRKSIYTNIVHKVSIPLFFVCCCCCCYSCLFPGIKKQQQKQGTRHQQQLWRI